MGGRDLHYLGGNWISKLVIRGVCELLPLKYLSEYHFPKDISVGAEISF